MRHLKGRTFGDLPVGATFWFTARTRTTRGATFRQDPDRAYVKVSERQYRDVDDPEGRFVYTQDRRDAGVSTSPPGGNRAGFEPPISREQYEDVLRRERAYEAAREQFDPRRFKRGGGYTPEEVAQIERLAGGPAPTNEERGLAQMYDWLVNVPDQALLYYDKDKTRVSGWMGDVYGEIVWRGEIQRKFGGGRAQAFRVRGTNGAMYHGIANLTGGDYVRLRKMKG